MTTTRSQDQTGDDTASYTDFGTAVTRLQESMDGLSEDMAGLGEATKQLERSTRELSDKQGEISERMARTADEIRSATGEPTPRIDGSRGVAPADD